MKKELRSVVQSAAAFLRSLRPPQSARQRAGRTGERAALRYLKGKGFDLVCRNWRSLHGELDLVMVDREELVFVEVKTRTEGTVGCGSLFDTVTPEKKRNLRRAAESFVRSRFSSRFTPQYRIDLLGVVLASDGSSVLEIEHHRAAL